MYSNKDIGSLSSYMPKSSSIKKGNIRTITHPNIDRTLRKRIAKKKLNDAKPVKQSFIK